jgi:hypothetical protein
VLVKQQNAGSNLRISPWPTVLEGGGDLVQTDTCTRSVCPPPGGRIYVQAYIDSLPVPVTPCVGPAALAPPPQSLPASSPPPTEAGGEGGRDLQLSAASDTQGTVVQLYIPGLNKLETFLVIALVAVVVLLTCGYVVMRCTMTEDEIEALHRSISRHDERRKANYSTEYEEDQAQYPEYPQHPEEEAEYGYPPEAYGYAPEAAPVPAPRRAGGSNRVAPSFMDFGFGESEPPPPEYPPRQFSQPDPEQGRQFGQFGMQ